MTTLQSCEVGSSSGFPVVFVRLMKGDEKPHLFSISPSNTAQFCLSQVNANLVAMGFDPVSDEDALVIEGVANTAHTPDVRAAYAASLL